MKIGLVLERFDPARGGLEHWTWQFARNLLRLGHEVHVVAFEFSPDAESDGLVAHRLEMPRSRNERAEAIAARLPALGFDVVHDMGVGWEADIIHPHGGSTLALWEHNLLRIPKWRQIRFWREKRYHELAKLERRQHASRAVIVAVSRMVQGHFETLHHLPAARVRLIYNGVDVEQYTPQQRNASRTTTRAKLSLAENEVMFLMLAHNLLLKNADGLIRAAGRLVAAGLPARVVIAGGKKTDRFIKLASKLGISEKISFHGLVDPLPYYAAADVFVHPTWYDPCSLVTLEASASRLPVITTRFNGASELMTDGKEGFILDDPADVGALAGRMQELLEAGRREKMGEAGRAMAMNHTFEQQTARFLELYNEIIAGKPSIR